MTKQVNILLLICMIPLPVRAATVPNPNKEKIAVAPNTLPEFQGISIGMTLGELVQNHDARETTGVPRGTSELDAIAAKAEMTMSEQLGMRQFKVRTKTDSVIGISIDNGTKKVVAMSTVLPLSQFAPMLIKVTKRFGEPTVSQPRISGYDVQWRRDKLIITLGLQLGMESARELVCKSLTEKCFIPDGVELPIVKELALSVGDADARQKIGKR